MDDIPHLAVPIRLAGNKFVTNQQDTDDEIIACVWAICQTPKEHRAEKPAFGIDDPTFEDMPIDTNSIEDQIAEWEPRAVIEIDLITDIEGIQTVSIEVTGTEEL